MKRTKENWIVGHPDDREGISGLRFFDGEDLHYQERKKEFQKTQKQWIDEYLEARAGEKDQEIAEDRAWAFQIAQCDRMRGMLEDKHDQDVRRLNIENKDANVQLAREKKQREKEEKLRRLQDEREDYSNQTMIRTIPPYINPFSS